MPPEKYLVVISLWGKDLPEGEIIAPDSSYKGIQREVRSEGRHFINPLFYSVEWCDMVKVPTGKCLVLTRLYGRPIPAERLQRGDYLAEDGPDGERGIVGEVLRPGNYRLNKYAYSWELVDAIEINQKQVGVKTLKIGKDASALKGKAASPYVVPEGYRGVQDKMVSPGTHYLNPYVASLVSVDVSSHPVEFTDIDFPSRDGFTIRPHVKITYHVLAAKAPEVFVMLSDEGKLHQNDATAADQEKNEILKKVVLPLIRGYVRIEGSKIEARDFFTSDSKGAANAQNPREKLAQELAEKVRPVCEKDGIMIEQITLTQPEPTAELRDLVQQISDRKVAQNEQLTNEQKVKELKTKVDRAVAEVMKQRETDTGEVRKKFLEAETTARQEKKNAELEMIQKLQTAQLSLDAAREEAKGKLSKGKAEADVIQRQNDAEIAALKTKVRGFPSTENYAQYQLMSKMLPAVAEIFASDTSDFAKLFSGYMTPPGTKAATAKGNESGGPPMK